MSLFEKYESFCGEKIVRLIWKTVIIFGLLIAYPVIIRGILPQNFTSLAPVFIMGQFSSIMKAYYVKRNGERGKQDYENFKAVYLLTMITMVIFTLFSAAFTNIFLAVRSDEPVDFMKMIYEVEIAVMLYALVSLSLMGSSYRWSNFIYFVVIGFYAGMIVIAPETTSGRLIGLAVLIPVTVFCCTKLVLASTRIRWEISTEFDENENEISAGLLDRLNKSYRIYTGKKFGYLFKLYVIMNAVLFVTVYFFNYDGSFATVSSSIQTAVVVTSMGIFSAIKCEPSELFHRKSCYLLTIKNKLAVYKDYYFATYFSLLANLLVFIILTYVAGGLRHNLPENFHLHLISDVASLLMLFSVIPFMFTSKSAGILMVKVMIVSIAFVPVKIFMVRFHWSLMIAWAFGALVIMFYSNRHWLKRMTRMYQEA